MIKVMLADDEDLVRSGLRMILSSAGDMEVVAECDDGHLVADLARRHRPHVVLLDSAGKQLDSEALASWLEDRRQAGLDLCFVVGGPYGTRLDRCDTALSLGRMTLPHQLARVVLLEQLFRAHKILAGEPYHH